VAGENVNNTVLFDHQGNAMKSDGAGLLKSLPERQRLEHVKRKQPDFAFCGNFARTESFTKIIS
jgi:hypothetical protein